MSPGTATRTRPPIAVTLAWRRYLVATRTAPPKAYERIEEEAWQELREELETLERRRRSVV